jgi:hypothetical protein
MRLPSVPSPPAAATSACPQRLNEARPTSLLLFGTPRRRHFPLEPAEHDVERTKPKSPEELGVSETQLAIKSNIEGDEVAKVGGRGSGWLRVFQAACISCGTNQDAA